MSGGLKVTPGFTDVTATEGTDYTENTTALTFTGTAGRDAELHGGDDRRHGRRKANETFTVGLTVSGTTATVTATDTADGDDQRRRQRGGDDRRRLGQPRGTRSPSR